MVFRFLLALVACSTALADNPDSGFPKSPEVHADGSVTFRFRASGETAPSVKGGFLPGGELEMAKGDSGFWEAKTAPLDTGIYGYGFGVGGASVTDPHNRWLKRWRVCQSLFEVPARPGDRPQAWQVQGVPHGEVHLHTYHSRIIPGAPRKVRVYTPPFYGFSEQSYPVIYLLHGSGDDPTGWTETGRAHVIADNLIAANLARRCIIVMPYGHGSERGENLNDEPDKDIWYAKNNTAIIRDLLETVKPMVEKRYRVSTGPDNTAVAGLSMGGGQALQLALERRDTFSWGGVFSAWAPPAVLENAKVPETPHKLLWIGCGKDDFLTEWNKGLQEKMDATKMPHTFVWSEGGHDWPVWRSYFEMFLTNVFK